MMIKKNGKLPLESYDENYVDESSLKWTSKIFPKA
jgi:hypothetical protein